MRDGLPSPPNMPLKKRSGSETRQRTSSVLIRFTPEEREEVEKAASQAGLTMSSYGRLQMLKEKPPRSVRRPPVEVEAIARLLAALGKIGSNLNQIARAINSGDQRRALIDDAIAEAEAFKDHLRRFLGRRD